MAFNGTTGGLRPRLRALRTAQRPVVRRRAWPSPTSYTPPLPTPSHTPSFRGTLECSGHVTIRLIVFRDGPLAGGLSSTGGLGVLVEADDAFGVLALDFEPDALFTRIYDLLGRGAADGSWGFEEGNGLA